MFRVAVHVCENRGAIERGSKWKTASLVRTPRIKGASGEKLVFRSARQVNRFIAIGSDRFSSSSELSGHVCVHQARRLTKGNGMEVE